MLLYRRSKMGIEVLLIHPGGPFWRKKDEGAWQIPKGAIEPDEEPAAAAAREFGEELGLPLTWPLIELGIFQQAGGKRVHLFIAEGDLGVESIRSNPFELEWPPGSGRLSSFPEVDRAAWFSISEARRVMLQSQQVALDLLLDHLG